MEEYSQENEMTQQENRDRWAEIRAQVNRPLVAGLVGLLLILGLTAAYGMHQRAMVRDLTAQSATAAQNMAHLQTQVNALNAQIQGLTQDRASQPQRQPAETATDETAPDAPATVAAASAVTAAPAAKPAPAKHHSIKRASPGDKRYAQMQAQLAEQQKELKDTQDQVEKYRSDMEGNINSTRGELSGAIAKNHDELVALEKKGERNYFEFELTKSKQFERVGPVSLSLRRADSKHKSYDLSMIVDDNELSKKKVNLYEPVTIHAENDRQPVQIVVNHIDKNLVHGYVSAPKYRASELTPASASVSTPAASGAPAAVHDTTSNEQRPQ